LFAAGLWFKNPAMNPQWPTLFICFSGIYLLPFLVSLGGRGFGWKLLGLLSVAGMAFTPMSPFGMLCSFGLWVAAWAFAGMARKAEIRLAVANTMGL
jgi:hypothetical protein